MSGRPRPEYFEIRGPAGVLSLAANESVDRDLALLIAGETSGRNLDVVLEEFGVARSTYYEKLRRFREQGLAGLLRASPGPKGPRVRTEEITRRIVVAKLQDPSRSVDSIVDSLRREGCEISPRSVERTLSQYELTSSKALPPWRRRGP